LAQLTSLLLHLMMLGRLWSRWLVHPMMLGRLWSLPLCRSLTLQSLPSQVGSGLRLRLRSDAGGQT
jgi:hypothetical protein